MRNLNKQRVRRELWRSALFVLLVSWEEEEDEVEVEVESRKVVDVFSRAGSHVHSGSAGDFGVKLLDFDIKKKSKERQRSNIRQQGRCWPWHGRLATT